MDGYLLVPPGKAQGGNVFGSTVKVWISWRACLERSCFFFLPPWDHGLINAPGAFAVLPGDNRYRAVATFKSLVHSAKLNRVEPFRPNLRNIGVNRLKLGLAELDIGPEITLA